MLLSYRLPREPSRLRLAVWRRLKRLGATVLHDAVWLLPADAKTWEAIPDRGSTSVQWRQEAWPQVPQYSSVRASSPADHRLI